MGRVCSIKQKTKKNAQSAIVPDYYSVLFSFAWEVTKKYNSSGSSEDYHLCFVLYCSVHLRTSAHKRASSTVQVVGKFWSLHNPQKLCMCQISWFSRRSFMLTETLQDLECVKVPMPAHQSLPLTAYIFEAYSTSTMQARKIQSILNLCAGIGTSAY